jgi:hypothetical protein
MSHLILYLYFFSGSTAHLGLWPPRPWCFFITHNDASQSLRLLWTSDQLVAETSTWQHTQQINIHTHGGIWTHDRSRRAAVELRLRTRGHWDRPHIWVSNIIFLNIRSCCFAFICYTNSRRLRTITSLIITPRQEHVTALQWSISGESGDMLKRPLFVASLSNRYATRCEAINHTLCACIR